MFNLVIFKNCAYTNKTVEGERDGYRKHDGLIFCETYTIVSLNLEIALYTLTQTKRE